MWKVKKDSKPKPSSFLQKVANIGLHFLILDLSKNTHTHICICICDIYVYIYMCVCTYICIYIYTIHPVSPTMTTAQDHGLFPTGCCFMLYELWRRWRGGEEEVVVVVRAVMVASPAGGVASAATAEPACTAGLLFGGYNGQAVAVQR